MFSLTAVGDAAKTQVAAATVAARATVFDTKAALAKTRLA